MMVASIMVPSRSEALLCQLVLLQKMAERQDGGGIWDAVAG